MTIKQKMKIYNNHFIELLNLTIDQEKFVLKYLFLLKKLEFIKLFLKIVIVGLLGKKLDIELIF